MLVHYVHIVHHKLKEGNTEDVYQIKRFYFNWIENLHMKIEYYSSGAKGVPEVYK